MGRPISKRLIGDTNTTGLQLLVTEAWIPGNSGVSPTDTVWIKRQISKHRFVVSDGVTEGQVYLQDGPITAEGQARIKVYPFGVSGDQYSSQINNHTIKTSAGNVYSWNINVLASETGQADLHTA